MTLAQEQIITTLKLKEIGKKYPIQTFDGGKLIKEEYPDGTKLEIEYDGNGKVSLKKFPDGTETKYEDGIEVYDKTPDGKYIIDGKIYSK